MNNIVASYSPSRTYINQRLLRQLEIIDKHKPEREGIYFIDPNNFAKKYKLSLKILGLDYKFGLQEN